MKISVDQTGKVTILRPQGAVRVGEGDVALRNVVKEQLDQGRKLIVLDMESVSFLDSAGLGELVAALKRVREAGGDLKIAHVSQRVSDALHVTQLTRVLDVYKDVTEAIASFL
ncbi:MAG: anti-sigma factor antagonist [Acidobacteria bacterium]|nr:MAG: anti-sigma factor antagonist [Acidobacteriota bacterium]